MGSSCSQQSDLGEDVLQCYAELTYFTKAEILHVFHRFRELDPEALKENRNAIIKMSVITSRIEELAVNPFKERLCRVFSRSNSGDLTFEDFLDMMSVLSENAPKIVKVEWAFKVYDFSNDNVIDQKDIVQMIDSLCGEDAGSELGGHLNIEDSSLIAEKIIKEADLDGDKMLNFFEFETVMMKCPEFLNTFRLRL